MSPIDPAVNHSPAWKERKTGPNPSLRAVERSHGWVERCAMDGALVLRCLHLTGREREGGSL